MELAVHMRSKQTEKVSERVRWFGDFFEREPRAGRSPALESVLRERRKEGDLNEEGWAIKQKYDSEMSEGMRLKKVQIDCQRYAKKTTKSTMLNIKFWTRMKDQTAVIIETASENSVIVIIIKSS